MHLFEIENVAFNLLGHPVSYVELIGTVFGLASVYFASKANILTWPTGIVNEAFLLILFFQVQLYADMFLQIYFFAVTLYGWYQWNKTSVKNQISRTSLRNSILLGLGIIAGTLISGSFFSSIHLYLPRYFKIQAAYPYLDSFVMVSSIVATVLLANKKIENWYLWIGIDLICVALFFTKGIYFLSLEYFFFLLLASYGLFNWRKQLTRE